LLGRRNLLGLAALSVIVIAAVWLWPWAGPERPVAAARETVAAGSIRVAVLPFTPHGLETDDGELSVGVAQLVSLNLDAHNSIDAVSHRTVLQVMEARELDLASVNDTSQLSSLAADIGATTILLGDVHASGDQLRIVADLVDSGTGTVLAQANVRGSRDALFELLDELTATLAVALGLPADTTSS